MAEAVEAGANLAWRLLATLEVGSLIVATSALLAYTTRAKVINQRQRKTVKTVLITNTTNALGEELKNRLESYGCIVRTVIEETPNSAEEEKCDCLILIGAESETGLDGISRLVSTDVYENLNLLESLATRVRHGGSIAWACAGETAGAYRDAAAAFDTVLQASLRHVAKNSHCEPVWVGRYKSVSQAADKIITELLPCATSQNHRFSFRYAAYALSGFLNRWLKMAS